MEGRAATSGARAPSHCAPQKKKKRLYEIRRGGLNSHEIENSLLKEFQMDSDSAGSESDKEVVYE